MASDAFKQKVLAQARAFHADALKQSKKKLQDYIRASSGDATHRQTVANYTKTPDSKIASRNAGQERAQQRLNKLGEDVSAVITNSDDRRKYNSLRSMQSDRLAKAKKSKDLVRAGHEQMAQRHGDDAESILDKYRKESTDVCHVCGQTPCNCTHIEEAKATMCGRCGTKHVHPSKGGTCPALKEEQESVEEAKSSVLGVSGKRTTAVLRAIRHAQKKPPELANESVVSEANKHSFVGKIQRLNQLKNKVDSSFKAIGDAQKAGDSAAGSKAFRKHERYANLERPGTWTKVHEDVDTSNPYVVEGLVDESSDKLYAGFQADVLSLKAKAKKQEQERGPVDIQKLAARLKAVKLPPEGNKK